MLHWRRTLSTRSSVGLRSDWVLNQHRQSSSNLPLKTHTTEIQIEFLKTVFTRAPGQTPSDALGRFFFFLSEPIPWLFSPGQCYEKPYSLVKGHLPEKTSSGPWLEIAGQVRSCLRCRECVKLPPSTWCFTQGHSSHQTLSPWLWNVCGLQRQFFWFWCPHTNCQHTVSFFRGSLMYLKGLLPWARSHSAKCV